MEALKENCISPNLMKSKSWTYAVKLHEKVGFPFKRIKRQARNVAKFHVFQIHILQYFSVFYDRQYSASSFEMT